MGTITIDQYNAEQEQRNLRKEEMNRQKVVLSLRKSGDIARLRFLLDLNPMIAVSYHFAFNAANPSETIKAVCAKEFGKPCFYCNQAAKQKNKDLRPGEHIALPAWLHGISNKNVDDSEYQQFYEDEQGYKILMLKRGADAVGTLLSHYDDARTILGCDWKYSRTGSGRDGTKYTLISVPSQPIDEDLPETSADDVMRLLAAAYPYVVDER